MAELSITAASVAKGSDAFVNNDYLAGEAGTAGQTVYHSAADGKWYRAQADGTAAESGSGALVGPGGFGIATHTFAAGQPLQVQKSGDITIGAALSVGTHYFLGLGYGSIGAFSDLTSGKYVTRVGYAKTTTVMTLDVKATGVTI